MVVGHRGGCRTEKAEDDDGLEQGGVSEWTDWGCVLEESRGTAPEVGFLSLR